MKKSGAVIALFFMLTVGSAYFASASTADIPLNLGQSQTFFLNGIYGASHTIALQAVNSAGTEAGITFDGASYTISLNQSVTANGVVITMTNVSAPAPGSAEFYLSPSTSNSSGNSSSPAVVYYQAPFNTSLTIGTAPIPFVLDSDVAIKGEIHTLQLISTPSSQANISIDGGFGFAPFMGSVGQTSPEIDNITVTILSISPASAAFPGTATVHVAPANPAAAAIVSNGMACDPGQVACYNVSNPSALAKCYNEECPDGTQVYYDPTCTSGQIMCTPVYPTSSGAIANGHPYCYTGNVCPQTSLTSSGGTNYNGDGVYNVIPGDNITLSNGWRIYILATANSANPQAYELGFLHYDPSGALQEGNIYVGNITSNSYEDNFWSYPNGSVPILGGREGYSTGNSTTLTIHISILNMAENHETINVTSIDEPNTIVGQPATFQDCQSSGYSCMSGSSCVQAGGQVLAGYNCTGFNICCSISSSEGENSPFNKTVILSQGASTVFSSNGNPFSITLVNSSSPDNGQSGTAYISIVQVNYPSDSLNVTLTQGQMNNFNPSIYGFSLELLSVGESSAQIYITGMGSATATSGGNSNSASCSTGCEYNGKCIPFGYRVGTQYCDVTGNLTAQLTSGQCDNSFQCSSNLCVNSQCVTPSLIQQIVNFFAKLLGINQSGNSNSNSQSSGSQGGSAQSSNNNKMIAIFPSSGEVTIQGGNSTPAGFAFTVKNSGASPESVSYKVFPSDLSKCESATSAAASSYIINPAGSFNLHAGETSSQNLIMFQAPIPSSQCTIVYTLRVTEDSNSLISSNVSVTIQ